MGNEQGQGATASFLVSLRAVDHKLLSRLVRLPKNLQLEVSEYKDDFQLQSDGMEAVCAPVSRVRKCGSRIGKDRGA